MAWYLQELGYLSGTEPQLASGETAGSLSWAPLTQHVLEPINQMDLHLPVVDFVDSSGEWDLGSFSDMLPTTVCDRIRAMVPPSIQSVGDCLAWGGKNDGNFATPQPTPRAGKMGPARRASPSPPEEIKGLDTQFLAHF